MNRRQRRQLEKQTGVLKYKKSLNYKDRAKRLSNTAKRTSDKNKEMSDTRRRQEQEGSDNAVSAEISSMATTLMVTEGLSFINALNKAREIYKTKSAE